ncbi:MAG: DNA recombination protein RmuC [Bacilli bacterium]
MNGIQIAMLVISILSIFFSIALVILIVIIIKGKSDPHTDQDTDKVIADSLFKIKSSNDESLNNIKDAINDYKKTSEKEIQDSYIKLLDLVTSQLNQMNDKVNKNLQVGFDNNNKSMNEVNKALGEITVAQKNLDSLNTQVTNLNNVLTNNQTRGRFGEVALESLLNNVFGATHGLYETQYVMKDGVRPDAVVFLPDPDKLVCIDSKFPFNDYAKLFDNNTSIEEKDQLNKGFKAALKQEVTKIANDYIKLGETSSYAIMFIPSDGIYSYIQTNDDFYLSIVEYARTKNVILTSPSTLQPILANIKVLRVNYEVSKNIKDIILQIQKLSQDNLKFTEDWSKVSLAITSLNAKKDDFDKRVDRINKRTSSIIDDATSKELIE